MDLGKLQPHVKSIPDGWWIALSHDATRVVASDVDLATALQKAREAGEDNPLVVGRDFFRGDPHLCVHRLSNRSESRVP
jgi:hypothetical protein